MLIEVRTFLDVWPDTCHEQSLQHLGYGMQVGDRSIVTSDI